MNTYGFSFPRPEAEKSLYGFGLSASEAKKDFMASGDNRGQKGVPFGLAPICLDSKSPHCIGGIALKVDAKFSNKANTNKDEIIGDQDNGNSDSKTLNLMVTRFSKFSKYEYKANAKSEGNRRFSKKKDQPTTLACYKCIKNGHIRLPSV